MRVHLLAALPAAHCLSSHVLSSVLSSLLLCVHAAACREWTEDGQLWVQYVSSTPATRLEVINLQEQLDNQLQQRQARETGICPVREELYSQCFGMCLPPPPLPLKEHSIHHMSILFLFTIIVL
jgi:hypothetical protein